MLEYDLNPLEIRDPFGEVRDTGILSILTC